MAASVLLALSACGGGGGSSTPPPPPAAASATVSTSLSAATVAAAAGTVDLTITIANTGTSAVSGGALTIPLPAGTKSGSAFAVGSPCTSTSYGVGSTFALAGLAVPAGATCTNTITLDPTTTGTFVFTPTGLTSVTEGTTATLTIN